MFFCVIFHALVGIASAKLQFKIIFQNLNNKKQLIDMETKITVTKANGTVMAFEGDTQVGRLEFDFIQDGLSIEHTYTFKGYEGRGVASALVQAATDYAIEHNLKVKPTCSYAEAWYNRHPQYKNILFHRAMTKVYVMATCPDCRQAKAQLTGNPAFELIDIGEHVRNLKQFLALRDKHPAFDDAKAHGYVGIPCFVLEDGTVKFSIDEIQIEDTADGASCSLDGKGC